MKINRSITFVLVIVTTCALTGCDMFHNLQPHRLHRLNRGPGMSNDAYLSVDDPLPAGWEQWEAEYRRNAKTQSDDVEIHREAP